MTRFSLIVLFFLSLFSFLYFVFFLLLFFVLFQHYFSSFFIISNFISNFQCKKYDMNLKLSLRWLFLSQNHLRQIRQIVEVRGLLRCPGCLTARLYRAFAKCRINRKHLPKGSNHRYPSSFSNHRNHFTTLSWLKSSHFYLLQLNLSR